MSQTILVTGASSGIGRAAAHLFHEQGWDVVATMRRPEDAGQLAELDGVLVVRLDVTDLDSIQEAVAAGIERFGQIDVLLNNAGYGAFGPLEAATRETIVRQFDTNVIGLLDTTRTLLPHFRSRGSGTVVNVSSMGGRVALPLGSLYHGTKFAVEGISEALAYELGAIGVGVKVIEPGVVTTDFAGRSLDVSLDPAMPEYLPLAQEVQERAADPNRITSSASLVADTILEAVTDDSRRLRYVVGQDAEAALAARDDAGDEAFMASVRSRFGLG